MLNKKIVIGAAFVSAFVLGAAPAGTLSAQPDQISRDQTSPLEGPRPPASQESAGTSFSEHEVDEFGKILRFYLMKNPEIVIEAINEYTARQRAAEDDRAASAISENLSALLDPSTSYVAGKNSAKATVSVVEMYDYHCGFCKRAAEFVNELATTDEAVKVIFRELPVLRAESEYAAGMALASRAQGKFLEFHFAMMDASGVLTKERVRDIAQGIGLDLRKMDAAFEDEAVSATLAGNRALAGALGIEGTPAFIVASTNGTYVAVVSGHNPDELLETINTAREAGS